MDLSTFLDKRDKEDIGVAGAGYAAGFAIDVLLLPGGIPPGTAAGVWAIGAVGIKYVPWPPIQRRLRRRKLRNRGLALLAKLANPGDGDLYRKLNEGLDLWSKGVISDDRFEELLLSIADTYLARQQDSSPNGS